MVVLAIAAKRRSVWRRTHDRCAFTGFTEVSVQWSLKDIPDVG
jgi:hypothetical protein